MTKIHTKIVIGMKSGAVERDEWHDYDGPVAYCGGGADESADSNRVNFISC